MHGVMVQKADEALRRWWKWSLQTGLPAGRELGQVVHGNSRLLTPQLKRCTYCSQSFPAIVPATCKTSFEIFYYHSGHSHSKKRSLNWENCKERLQEW